MPRRLLAVLSSGSLLLLLLLISQPVGQVGAATNTPTKTRTPTATITQPATWTPIPAQGFYITGNLLYAPLPYYSSTAGSENIFTGYCDAGEAVAGVLVTVQTPLNTAVNPWGLTVRYFDQSGTYQNGNSSMTVQDQVFSGETVINYINLNTYFSVPQTTYNSLITLAGGMTPTSRTLIYNNYFAGSSNQLQIEFFLVADPPLDTPASISSINMICYHSPSATSTPIPSQTLTSTPTPDNQHAVTLAAGGTLVVDRRVDYGALMIAGILLALLGVFLVVNFVHSREAK